MCIECPFTYTSMCTCSSGLSLCPYVHCSCGALASDMCSAGYVIITLVWNILQCTQCKYSSLETCWLACEKMVFLVHFRVNQTVMLWRKLKHVLDSAKHTCTLGRICLRPSGSSFAPPCCFIKWTEKFPLVHRSQQSPLCHTGRRELRMRWSVGKKHPWKQNKP